MTLAVAQPERIPDEALFQPDGHLGELALACIADGEVALVGARAGANANGRGAPTCAALAHLERCDACTQRLGEVALLSVGVGHLLSPAAHAPAPRGAPSGVLADQPSAGTLRLAATVEPAAPRVDAPQPAPVTPRRARRPLPVAAIAAALTLALATAGPSIVEAAQGLRGAASALLSMAPFLGRMALSVLRAPWTEGPVALVCKLVSATVLLVIGFQVARAKTRGAAMQEGGV